MNNQAEMGISKCQYVNLAKNATKKVINNFAFLDLALNSVKCYNLITRYNKI